MKSLLIFSTILLLMTFNSHSADVNKLINALHEQTPIIKDLQELTDQIGGRLTGTKANEMSVEWALNKFHEADVNASKEAFEMPRAWVEHNSSATVTASGIHFEAKISTMPFTSKTPINGLSAQIVDLSRGDIASFLNHKDLSNKWLLVETAVLDDNEGIHGLFQEYLDSVGIEQRAVSHKAAGIIYMSSRPQNLLYRHIPSLGVDNQIPIVVIEREQALKIKRLLNFDKKLTFTANLNISDEKPYIAHNVIAEIKGSEFPEEYVLIGAHIDSFDLGDGALDNGSNVALVIDIARQMKKLNIIPKRTIRFALFNGEEQGLFGSWGYTKTHKNELTKHILASTIDIGTGKITGFFTNGRTEIISTINTVLTTVSDLGPFEQVNVPVVGTDNYDFMMNGVANLVANQQNANYASNYHAESDTFDKVDQQQLKLNSVIMAALTLGIANTQKVPWQQQSMKEIELMVEKLDIESSMKTFGLYNSWKNKTRPTR